MLRKLLLSALVIGAVGVVAGVGTLSAFSSPTANPANSFAAGTVALADNDAGAALLSLASAKPGDSSTSCIEVTYTGTLDAGVRLYGTVTGALAPYLTLTVTRGTDAGAFGTCTGFTADAGGGVVYTGPLSSFPADWAGGIVDPQVGGGAETWSTGESHAYRFSVTLQSANAAQGLGGAADFGWEAQNL